MCCSFNAWMVRLCCTVSLATVSAFELFIYLFIFSNIIKLEMSQKKVNFTLNIVLRGEGSNLQVLFSFDVEAIWIWWRYKLHVVQQNIVCIILLWWNIEFLNYQWITVQWLPLPSVMCQSCSITTFSLPLPAALLAASSTPNKFGYLSHLKQQNFKYVGFMSIATERGWNQVFFVCTIVICYCSVKNSLLLVL